LALQNRRFKMREVRDPPTVSHTDALEMTPHHFVAEASEIGLPVGVFPPTLRTDIGNGQPFVRVNARCDAEGDIWEVVYRQLLGISQARRIQRLNRKVFHVTLFR
jgi:hypothetical protein